MHLFLTSSPCDDYHVPQGLNIPCVFNALNGQRELLRACLPAHPRTVMIASTPDAHGRNDVMSATFAAMLKELDREAEDFLLIDDRNADATEEAVKNADFVLLSGGHVPTENRWFHQLGLRDRMQDFGGVVMGISAGSMNCADEVYAQPEEKGESVDPKYHRWLTGLGLTDVNVLPHYNLVKDNHLDGRRLIEGITFDDSWGHEFVVLEDGAFVYVTEERCEVRGNAWIIQDGEMRPVCATGGAVPLR